MGAFDQTLGVLFISNVAATTLWGVSCVQAWHYFCAWPKDSPSIKIMVTVAWTLDTVHQGLITYALYEYAVTHFTDAFYLSEIPRTSAAEVALAFLVCTMVQGFYIAKIWKLSKHRWPLVIPLVTILIAQTGIQIAQIIEIAHSNSWADMSKGTRASSYIRITFILPAVIDVLSALEICALLSVHRVGKEAVGASPVVQQILDRTRRTINKILVFTMSTNALTSAFALADAVLIVWPRKIYWMLIMHIIVRLYTNSFLAALNMRSYFRGERNDSVQIRTSLVFSPRSGAGNGLNHSTIEIPMQDDPESMQDSSSRRAQGRSAC